MGFLKNLFSSGAGDVINSVGNVLDKVITTKGEKMQLQLEIDKAEQQFQIEMKNLSLQEQQAILGSIASAQKRETDIQTNPNATRLGKNISSYLAIAGTLLCFALFFVLLWGKNLGIGVEGNEKDIVIYILGVLSTLLTQIYSYYFGSSQGSAAKTDIINTMHQSTVNK